MPDEKNAVDSFLGDINKDETNPFNEPKEDKVAEVGEPEIEEKLPFHQDPKVQKYIDREIQKRIGDLPPREVIREVPTTPETSDLKDVLTRLIGNDTPEKIAAVKDFEKALNGLEEKGAQRALDQIRQSEEAEHEAEVEAQNELQQGFDDIESQFDVDLTSSKPTAQKLRSDFVDFIKRVSPKDGEGNVVEFPDLQETFKLFKETRKPESNDKAKELSNRSMIRSGDASVTPQVKDNSWNAVERVFGKMFS